MAPGRQAEDDTSGESSECRLISEERGGQHLATGTGPVSDKEQSAAFGARSGRNAGGRPDLASSPSASRGASGALDRGGSTLERGGVGQTVSDASEPCHLEAEIGALHAALRHKDLLIASLQSQLLTVCQSRSSREAEREARQRERDLLLERSAHLQLQIERRRAHVKNARLTLDQLDTTERNIDDCIRRAELEYRLETEELNILNLQGEHLRLRSRLEGGEDEAAPPPPAASLSSCLPSHADVSLHCVTVPYDPGSPCFSVVETAAEPGVLVQWVNDACSLSVGDRLLEVNGHPIASTTTSSGSSGGGTSGGSSSGGGGGSGGGAAGIHRLLADSGTPLRLLVLRCRPPSLGRRAGPAAAAAALQQELTQLAGRLQQKTQLNKALRAETQRCADETAAYRAENQRLIRRVRQLEMRVQQMQSILDKIRGVTDESLRPALDTDGETDSHHPAESPPPSRVPDGASDNERSPVISPRDPHLISVTVPAEKGVSPLSLPAVSGSVVSLVSSPATPSLPSSPTTPSFSACPTTPSLPSSPITLSPPMSPISPSFSGGPPSPRSPSASLSTAAGAAAAGSVAGSGAGATARPPRPLPAPRPRSLLQRLQLFGERRLHGAAASLQRPRPPQKPARLSLQRAISLQTLQHEEQAEEPRSRPARPAVQTWPSMDGNLEMVRQQRPRPVRVRHQMCSLPRPGRTSATRTVPI